MWFPSHFAVLLNVDEVHAFRKEARIAVTLLAAGFTGTRRIHSGHQLKTPLPHSRMPNTWSERGEEFASSDEKGRRPNDVGPLSSRTWRYAAAVCGLRL